MLFSIYSKACPSGKLAQKSQRLRRAKLNEGIGWTVLSLMALVACMFISIQISAAESSGPRAGVLQFTSGEKAMHLRTEVDASIAGLVAQVSYKQRFRNDSESWQEAVYVIPLPEGVAVNAMELRVGERVIVGEIKEKQQAEKIYQQARQQGKKAALLGQQRSNLFRQRLSNIAPGEEVDVEIQFVQQVSFDQGRFEWRLPTTLTPRYPPGEQANKQQQNEPQGYDLNPRGWGVPTADVPDADKITPLMAANDSSSNPLSLNVQLDAGLPLAEIDALYHKIDVSKERDFHRVVFQRGEEPMDRDVVLQWRPIASSAPSVAVFRQSFSSKHSHEASGDYLLLMVLPPTMKAPEQYLPRDMIFVIDTSGSMGGTSIQQAKQSLKMALGRLQEHDRFNIVEFDSSYTQLFTDLEFASEERIEQGKEWVKQLRADDGTEMYPALEAALQMGGEDTQRVRQVLFITDGAVGNEQALFNLIHEQLGDARLFTVGIGSAPNSYFMKKAAQFGQGSFSFIGDISETRSRMNELFTKIESVAATNIHVSWPQAGEFFPRKIPDLYAGEPLILLGKSDALQGEVVVEGSIAEQDWRKSLVIDDSETKESGIASLWARQKIESLLDEKVEGRPAEEVRSEIVPLALSHRLVTEFTSFVAAEKIASRLQESDLKESSVANLMPQGQNISQVTYPQTASPMLMNFLISGIFGLIVLLLRYWRLS